MELQPEDPEREDQRPRPPHGRNHPRASLQAPALPQEARVRPGEGSQAPAPLQRAAADQGAQARGGDQDPPEPPLQGGDVQRCRRGTPGPAQPGREGEKSLGALLNKQSQHEHTVLVDS